MLRADDRRIATRGSLSLRVVLVIASLCVAQLPGAVLVEGEQPERAAAWRTLFDGKTLKGWESSNFGGEGEVEVQDGQIILEMGSTLTGISWVGGDLPRMDYEISLEAMKLEGNDFFCGLTFPVDDSFCSFIVGGWGGGVVGLSSLDGKDAARNETTRVMGFSKQRWYRIGLRVTHTKIEAWIDEEKVVDADTTGRRISIRPEVDLSRPLGIAAWMTTAALRDIRIRRIE